MSKFLPKSIKTLIEELSKLPGIGPKSAQRLAIYLLHSPDMRVDSLSNAVKGLKSGVLFCQQCWNIGENEPCDICNDPTRDRSLICVVEEVLDVFALEKTGDFNGLYHVLHGSLSPVDGIGPEQLKIEELFTRIAGKISMNEAVNEVILATNPSLEGEATALYIQKHLKNFDLRVTRIALGLPVGGDLEYADSITLSRAFTGRSEF